jgi:hypothetical protein
MSLPNFEQAALTDLKWVSPTLHTHGPNTPFRRHGRPVANFGRCSSVQAPESRTASEVALEPDAPVP